jgi:hypothetical protein
MWIDIPYLVKWRVLYFTKKSTTLNYLGLWLCHMVFNATFKNISVISWQLVLLMEETEYPEKTPDWQTSSHNVVTNTPRLSGIRTHESSVNGHEPKYIKR